MKKLPISSRPTASDLYQTRKTALHLTLPYHPGMLCALFLCRVQEPECAFGRHSESSVTSFPMSATRKEIIEIKKTPTCAVAAEAGGGRQRRENPQTKKAAASYLPLRVFSPPRRLTSEFGMESGVSAWLSPPPGSSMPCPLETECHCPQPFEKKLRFYEPPGRSALPPAGKIWRSPRAIGATWLCTLPCLHRSSIKRVTCPCPYPLSGWEAYCRERLRA